MAFNPFDVFRRNQRILFAILTVFIMFMFTLSFGQGDIFQWLPRWLGDKRGGGEVLAVIDGSKVTEFEVAKVRERRIIANQYMSAAAISSMNGLEKYLLESMSRVSAEHRQAVQGAATLRSTLGRLRLPPDFIRQFAGFTKDPLRAIILNPKAKPDDKEFAQAGIYLVDLLLSVYGSPNGLYFSNQPNDSNRDVIDFMLWKRKADKLGVTLTQKDTNDLVSHEFHGRVSGDDLNAILADLRKKPRFSMDLLESALADEFRVRAAQAAVMGQGFARSNDGGRGFDAPFDYFRYYQDQCSTARFGVISVPAENYLDKVTAKPTEQELRDLFAKAKNVEPSPTNPVIGLKEPRRLQLGWLEITGNEPFYKAETEKIYKQMTLAAKAPWHLLLAELVPAYAIAFDKAAATAADPVLANTYSNYKKAAENQLQSHYFERGGPFSLPASPADATLVKPQNLAAMAGAAFGSQFTFGSPLTPALVFEQTAAVYDRQERAKGLAVALAPSTLFVEKFGDVGVIAARLPKPLPLDVVRPYLESEFMKTLSKSVVTADVKKFSEELAKIGSKPEKQAEAKAFIEKFVKDRGLKSGASTRFDDQYSMGDDPGLKPLKDRLPAPHANLGAPVPFGPRFFFTTSPETRQPVPATSLFSPEPYPFPFENWFGLDPIFLVWRSAEQPAEAPRDFNAPGVKAKTEAAWKRMKARELAKQAAEDLAKKTGAIGDNPVQVSGQLLDIWAGFRGQFEPEAARDRVRKFQINNVAPIVELTDFASMMQAGGRRQVGPFTVNPSADIPFPGPKMTQTLLDVKDKPVSTSVVLADASEDTYYVAVLESRFDRSTDDFGYLVYPSPPAGELAQAVFTRHQDELRKATRTAALELLQAEFRFEKKSDKLDAKGDSSFAD